MCFNLRRLAVSVLVFLMFAEREAQGSEQAAEGEGETTHALSDGISALADGSRSRLGSGGIYRPRISPKQDR
jgi:hypothetical protein